MAISGSKIGKAGNKSDPYKIAREKMVERHIAARGIRDEGVIKAMRSVPRHLFVDEALISQAYQDHPLPIGKGQTISQPYIVALMTEALELNGSSKVLEVGTGSGYQTAILCEIAQKVYSVERISTLLSRARRALDSLGYNNCFLKLDDGTWGWKEFAPYDAIIVTAASPNIPKPLLEQLNDSGSLVIPVGDSFSQDLVKVKKSDGEYEKTVLCGVRFVKLIGDHGWSG